MWLTLPHRLTSQVIPVDLEVVDGLVPRRSLAGAVVAAAPMVDLHHHGDRNLATLCNIQDNICHSDTASRLFLTVILF